MDGDATRLHLGLGPGWPDEAAAGGGVWRAHVAVRLGERALTTHLGTQPVVPFALALVDAVLALRARQTPSPIPLADEHVLTLRERDGAVVLSVTGGRSIVADEPTDGVEATAAALLHALADQAQHPSDRAALNAARGRLMRPSRRRAARRPPGSSVGPALATPPAHATAPAPRPPLSLDWRAGGDRPGLLIGFHDVVVPIGFRSPVEPGERLCAAVEALLQSRDWPRGRNLFRLGTDERRFFLLRYADRVEVSLRDPGEHALAPAADLSVRDLAEIVARFLASCASDPRTPAAAVRRLKRLHGEAARLCAWSEALAAGDRRGVPSEAPPYRPRGPLGPRPDGEELPVQDLMHLAYRRQWRTEAPGMVRVAAGRTRLLVYDDHGLHALAAESGERVWGRAGLRPLRGAPAAFALDPGGALLRVDPARGRVVWRSAASAALGGLRAVVPAAGVTLVGGGERTLLALDGEGEALWRYRTHYGGVAVVAAHGDLVLVGGEDGFIHAVHRRTGAPLFQTRVVGELVGPALAAPAGLLVTANREHDLESELTLLDPQTGAPRWQHRAHGEVVCAPAVVGEIATAVQHDGEKTSVLALSLATGEPRWRVELPACPTPATQSVGGDDLYVKGADGHLFAINRADGALRWAADPDDPHLELSVNAPPHLCRGILLAPGRHIRALDPRDGRVVSALDCGELVPSWMHVWSDGDLAIAEDDAIARYHLGGHLAIVR